VQHILIIQNKANDVVEAVILVFLGFKKFKWQSKIQEGLSINYHNETSQFKKELFKISCVDINRENIGVIFLL